jgi:hypothetical protein
LFPLLPAANVEELADAEAETPRPPDEEDDAPALAEIWMPEPEDGAPDVALPADSGTTPMLAFKLKNCWLEAHSTSCHLFVFL